jgi:hypothetical protein
MPHPTISAYQLACEGKADQVFYRRLLNENGKNVGVHSPERPLSGGITDINAVLVSFQSQYEAIERIVVLVDADDNPNANFTEAQRQITIANERNPAKQFAVPDTVNTFFRLGNAPEIAIVVAPDIDSKGCLDTMLLPSFEDKFKASLKCVDDYCACAKDAKRGFTRDGKLRLRVLIATAMPKTPGMSLANLLEEGHCPIDIAHGSFNAIRDILVGLFP